MYKLDCSEAAKEAVLHKKEMVASDLVACRSAWHASMQQQSKG